VSESKDKASILEQCLEAIGRLAELSRCQGGWWLSLDMSMRQVKAIFVLAIHGTVSVGKLGRILDLAEPTASLLVDDLVSKGLAVRETDPLDRRRTLVELTQEGASLVDRLQQTRDENVIRWLGSLEEDDLQAVLLGLEAILRAAQACAETGAQPEVKP
jgi:DNA-binding MarR family transcriptional regulator